MKPLFFKKRTELEELRSLLIQEQEKNRALERALANAEIRVNNAGVKLHNAEQRVHQHSLATQSLSATLLSEGFSPEEIYGCISALDPKGFQLYWAAEKITGIDPSRYFSTEDNLGYFEESDGYQLLGWVEKAMFGEIEWVQLNSPYEIAGDVKMHTDTDEYREYRNKLFTTTLIKLGVTA